MTAGRPAKTKERSALGQRLLKARQRAGLSQAQVAAAMNLPQPTYACWERTTSAIKPEYIVQLSTVFGVPVEFLLGKQEQLKKPPVLPKGKARQLLEDVAKLPRSKQRAAFTVLEAFVKQHAKTA